LAGFLLALHDIPLPETPPSNPVRDCPLSQKDADFHRRFAEVEARFPGADRMKAFWSQCCEIANADSPCWVAGDLHAGNVLVDTGTISAVIDWGDMCAGDPAVDLGSVWTVLPDRQERLAAVELYAPHKDLLRRAAGWALYFSVVKIQTGVGRSERDVASGREGYMRLLSDLDAPTLSVLLGQG
jgi:aminoglycoside phosphotransferase (APT) family kinase protein